jgi:hypothetical protein
MTNNFSYESITKAGNTTIAAEGLPSDEPVGALEPVAYFNGAMPTGVTVSQKGRIFVNFPKWGDEVSFTVAEIRNGETAAYPNEAINETNLQDPVAALMSVQSVIVDPVAAYGFLTLAARYSSRPSTAGRSWSASI